MYPELGIKEDKTLDSMDKAAERAFIVQNINSFFNQLTICFFMFAFASMTLTQMLEIFNSVTGWNWTVDEVIDAGRRAFTIQRLINVRDGITRKDDILPKKMTIAAKEGGRKGKVPLPHDKALDEYYRLRAWDKNGIPTEEALTRLGLDEYIKYLI
jgi:aldehyde:ferredoxin oxidoreductase